MGRVSGAEEGLDGVPKRHQPNSHATKAVSGVYDQGPLPVGIITTHPWKPQSLSRGILEKEGRSQVNNYTRGETATTQHLGSFRWVFHFLTSSMHEAGPPNLMTRARDGDS